MLSPHNILFFVIGLNITLLILVAVRPAMTVARAGKILAFLVLFIFPVFVAMAGANEHLEHSKETKFCLSCHTMDNYGKSLMVEDLSYLPAAHYQNNRVPRDVACFTCHTNYVMYGDLRAKLRGLRHVAVQYFGTPAKPLKLYTPFSNRECLHCHQGSRSFEEGATHNSDPEYMPKIKSNELSCISSGCHDLVHNANNLEGVKLWAPPKQ